MTEDAAYFLFAVPAVVLVGLAKGGFSGLGAIGTPLFAIGLDDPVRAAAILLPILIAQDLVGVAAFRKSWDGHVLAAMLPGAILGIGLGWALAAAISAEAVIGCDGRDLDPVRRVPALDRARRPDRRFVQFSRLDREPVRGRRRLHQPDRPTPAGRPSRCG